MSHSTSFKSVKKEWIGSLCFDVWCHCFHWIPFIQEIFSHFWCIRLLSRHWLPVDTVDMIFLMSKYHDVRNCSWPFVIFLLRAANQKSCYISEMQKVMSDLSNESLLQNGPSLFHRVSSSIKGRFEMAFFDVWYRVGSWVSLQKARSYSIFIYVKMKIVVSFYFFLSYYFLFLGTNIL